jgi:hypothetical protein
MNRQQKIHQKIQNTSEKKYCGVCHKAGKSEKEYTNHYTKSSPGPSGVVICPTILKNHCNKCNGYGHFSDYCKAKLASKNTDLPRAKETKEMREKSYEELWPAIGQVTGTKRSNDSNRFSVLEDERMPKEKPNTHKMNFKKMLEKEYIPRQKEDKFVGNMLVMNGKSTEVVKAILSGNIPSKNQPIEEFDNEWEDEYDEEEWSREDYEAEIDRRMEERNNIVEYYEDERENWEDAW